MARALWRGHLRFSLVTVPVRLYPAIDASAHLRFHQLHRVCQTRLQHRKWCPSCEREVDKDEVVRGYEFERGRYVALEEKDIKRVKPESAHVIHLTQFVEAGAIDRILIDQPYFLAPDEAGVAESFAVLREALEDRAAIGTLTLMGRAHLVALQPRGKGMVLYTMRHEDEVRDIGDLPELEDTPSRVPAAELQLARRVIGRVAPTIDFARYHDEYEEALRKMIKARIAGDQIVTPRAAEPPRVVNLMDALRKSLEQARTSGRPARVQRTPAPPARRRARRRAHRPRVARLPERRHA
jgi:DNA end-binding protein Ku